jgi:hypothetical protein
MLAERERSRSEQIESYKSNNTACVCYYYDICAGIIFLSTGNAAEINHSAPGLECLIL